MIEKYVKPDELATAWGVCATTVLRIARRNGIPVIPLGRLRRIRESDVPKLQEKLLRLAKPRRKTP